jgi:drug/metabolite transporter (DMT)-like permease
MLVGTTGFSMVGFSLMPLAESTAFLFVTPLVVVILSHWLLKESITGLHWIAVVAGFCGALLIARPGGALNLQGILWMSLAAACYAIYQIQTRQLSPSENTVTMLFYTALVGTVSMTLAAPLYWGGPTPDWIDAALIASLGIYGGTGHLLLTRAFRYAPRLLPLALSLCPTDMGGAARCIVLPAYSRPAIGDRHGRDRRQQPLHRACRTHAAPSLIE